MKEKIIKLPAIVHNGKEYFEVACKYCAEPDWALFFDGKDFVMKCKKCNHVTELKKDNVNEKPTYIYDARFFD